MNKFNKVKSSIHNYIIVAIFTLIIGIFAINLFFNNRGATEKLAYENATTFAVVNALELERISCVGDSDGDGLATCTLVTSEEEKIQLECAANWIDVRIMKASGCKEKSLVQF